MTIIRCPRCHGHFVKTLNLGRRTCSAIGIVAGVAGGASRALVGAEAGAAMGAVAGPLGSIAGGIIGGLLGGATGLAAGATLGEIVDRNILDNYHCLSCDFRFGRHDSGETA